MEDIEFALIGIDHVQIAIPRDGEDRAREFFVEKLGFSEIEKPPNLKKERRRMVSLWQPSATRWRYRSICPGAKGASSI